MSDIYWKNIPNCKVKTSSRVYSWRTVSDLRDPNKTKGFLLPEKDFHQLINKKFEQVTLPVELDYEQKIEVVLSNYLSYSKNKIIKYTEQVVFCLNDRTYKLTPVIYYEKDEDEDTYSYDTIDGVKPVYIEGKGVTRRGKVYKASMTQNRIIHINHVNIFVE
jgi:hypothetical protein